MSDELISIVMPYKNCAQFLEETLDSIIEQTYTNWELIAVNDNSEDNGEDIINNYSKKDKRIIPIKNTKKGIIGALNTGYNVTKGKYITRMDADDLMMKEKLSQLKKVLNNNNKDTVAIGKVHYFKSNGEQIGNGYLEYQNWINKLAVNENSFSEIYKECPIPSPSWMMKKSDFDKIGAFQSATYPEDYELAFRMYKNKISVIATPTIVHHWRDYNTRTSRIDENYKDNRFLVLKTNSFIEIDYQSEKQLCILGAGKKGKSIAKLLIDKNINFKWLCGTSNKIGHNIYGKIIKDSSIPINNAQIIVAIANKEEINRIKRQETPSNDYYYFC